MWLLDYLENAITFSKCSSRVCHCSSFSTFSLSCLNVAEQRSGQNIQTSTAITRLVVQKLTSFKHLDPRVLASTHWQSLVCWSRFCLTVCPDCHLSLKKGRRPFWRSRATSGSLCIASQRVFLRTSTTGELHDLSACSTMPLRARPAICRSNFWLFSTSSHCGVCHIGLVSSRSLFAQSPSSVQCSFSG